MNIDKLKVAKLFLGITYLYLIVMLGQEWLLVHIEKVCSRNGWDIEIALLLVGVLYHVACTVPIIMFLWNWVVTKYIEIDTVNFRQAFVLSNIVLFVITII